MLHSLFGFKNVQNPLNQPGVMSILGGRTSESCGSPALLGTVQGLVLSESVTGPDLWNPSLMWYYVYLFVVFDICICLLKNTVFRSSSCSHFLGFRPSRSNRTNSYPRGIPKIGWGSSQRVLVDPQIHMKPHRLLLIYEALAKPSIFTYYIYIPRQP